MSSFAERNREAIIRQLEGDSRLGSDKILSVAPVMRASVMMLVFSGIIGVIVVQYIIGFGGFQFAIGLIAGYAAYIAYLLATMGQPRMIGAMGVLTNKRVVLLGSKRVGIAGDWKHSDIETIKLLRKGNLLIMGKIAITPVGAKRLDFFLSNRGMGLHFMEQYEKLRK